MDSELLRLLLLLEFVCDELLDACKYNFSAYLPAFQSVEEAMEEYERLYNFMEQMRPAYVLTESMCGYTIQLFPEEFSTAVKRIRSEIMGMSSLEKLRHAQELVDNWQ